MEKGGKEVLQGELPWSGISYRREVPGTVGRPLIILTLAFAAGIATGVYISFPAGPLLIAAALVFAVLLSLGWLVKFRDCERCSPGRLSTVGLMMLVVLAGMAYETVHQSASRGTGASNPGEFDYAAYLARQGIYATLSIWDGGTIQKRGPSTGNRIIKAVIATKNRLELVLRKTLPEPHASLLAGLLFGSTGGLPEDLQQAFRDTGVFHILPTGVTRKP